MNSLNAALLVNLIGFAVGAALYGLLAAMVLRHREREGVDRLLLLTAGLGLVWNIGELFVFVERDFGGTAAWPFVTAAAYSALGFLPSVVVNSVKIRGGWRWITGGAYTISGFAAVLHFAAAFTGADVPSDLALMTLTYGSLVLTVALLLVNFRETLESKTIWATALLIFAASGLHLTGKSSENSWVVELFAHQSSLPLAFAILYQNYRFAFADLFLKRSISLLLITLVAFALYFLVAAPLLRYHETHDRNDVQAVSLIILLWVATALTYPAMHRMAVWFVDSVLLQRPDYAKVQASIAESVEKCQSAEATLDVVRSRLADVLTAERSSWHEAALRTDTPPNDLTGQSKDGGIGLYVPTAIGPAFEISLDGLRGGRRLLSEETSMLESVAVIASRQIDAIRVLHERCEREFREQEFSKLATEAQLAALRSQVNPHFLFNALTTIGYLIQTDADKAFATLLHLTKLLRGVLNASSEFCTLEDELKLIESYLDIERARFEEKLSVEVDVAADLRKLPIPSLILQPLVENAIKHGISENRNGGKVKITASIVNEGEGEFLELCVADTGAGASRPTEARMGGVGLKNVEERLRSHYGGRSSVTLNTGSSAWTTAKIKLPVAGRSARVHA